MPHHKFTIGAYAAMPGFGVWDDRLKKSFLEEIASLPLVGGFEIPFFGEQNNDSIHHFLFTNNTKHEHILTCIPGTMSRLETSPHFGLASADPYGRKAALEFMYQANCLVNDVNQKTGRQTIKTVEIHSAPRIRPEVHSSASSFLTSLTELASWDWSGASLAVEHCDAWKPGHPIAKGFLSLTDEHWVVNQLQGAKTQLGMAINWARSAIEEHSPDAPEKHAVFLEEHASLSGLMFSGTCVNDPIFGTWLDNHSSFCLGKDQEYSVPNCLLSLERIQSILSLVDLEKLTFLGLKVAPPGNIVDYSERLGYLRANIEALSVCVTNTFEKSYL